MAARGGRSEAPKALLSLTAVSSSCSSSSPSLCCCCCCCSCCSSASRLWMLPVRQPDLRTQPARPPGPRCCCCCCSCGIPRPSRSRSEAASRAWNSTALLSVVSSMSKTITWRRWETTRSSDSQSKPVTHLGGAGRGGGGGRWNTYLAVAGLAAGGHEVVEVLARGLGHPGNVHPVLPLLPQERSDGRRRGTSVSFSSF